MDEQWDRREKDRKARQDLSRQIEKLEHKLDSALERIGEEINEINEYLRGGPNNQDPLGTRVHLVETALTELKILVKGDALGRGSLIELTKQAVKDAEEAKKIAQGRVEFQTTKRGQNVSIILGALSLIGVISVGAFSNWDKITAFFGKQESPQEWVARIRAEIEGQKKTRGKIVQKQLKEIERAARGY